MSTSMGSDGLPRARTRDDRAQDSSRQTEAGRRQDPDLARQREKERYGGVAVAAVSLLGAVLGGLAGMRLHRKVDEVGRGR